jgi:hypothetical protein
LHVEIGAALARENQRRVALGQPVEPIECSALKRHRPAAALGLRQFQLAPGEVGVDNPTPRRREHLFFVVCPRLGEAVDDESPLGRGGASASLG